MPALTLAESVSAACEDTAASTASSLVLIPEARHGHGHGTTLAAVAAAAAHGSVAAFVINSVTTLVTKMDARYAAHE